MKKLIIVESPTKAKTISKFLGSEYHVESSYGHIRDLPKKELGIDVKNNFEPTYQVPEKASHQVAKLKKLAENSSEILFATDEDREGEAISWHLKEILKPKNYKRITFHEITKKAITKSLESPREIDLNLVDAQQARRILDRLVGYKLSPLLWKKIAKGLSAGRVQSVAVRLIVEKEREIQKFNKEEYWTIETVFKKNEENFEAKLQAINNKTLKKIEITNEEQAQEIFNELKDQNFYIKKVELKETKRKGPEPFKTSTLQQTANNKLGFSSKQTMMLAQQLYEGININQKGSTGLITYMRTDSLNLADDFLTETKQYLEKTFGSEYSLKNPKKYKTKSKGAQEAHEAIRPTEVTNTPESLKRFLDPKQYKLYKLIWERTVASQMPEALINSTKVDINDKTDKYTFRANGSTIKFPGYLKVYPNISEEKILPNLTEKETVNLEKIEKKQHFTQPPARYTEASLVKILEEYGIGRPSTYAPTISTIENRNYIEKDGKKLVPQEIAFIVSDLLVEHFSNIVDYKFTAQLEKDLDTIAEGKKEWKPVIKDFYEPFIKNLKEKDKELKKQVQTTEELCEKCEEPMVIRMGRYGKFLACSGYPECRNTKQIAGENNAKEKRELELTDEKCELCDAPLAIRNGRYGKFLSCSKYPECNYIKKKNYGTGVKCPECQEGEVVSRKGKGKGKKIFYGCSKYPTCKFVSWQKPTGEKCSVCKGLIIEDYATKTNICANKECETNQSQS